MTEEETQILERRARLLARPFRKPADDASTLEVMVFSAAGERYALETRFITKVTPFDDVALIPGASELVCGLLDLRGSLLVVVDLAYLLHGMGPSDNLSHAIVLGEGSTQLGLAVQQALEVRRILLSDVQAALARGCVRGATADGVVLLDASALLEDERLWVTQNHESEA